MFSRGVKWEHWQEMGLISATLESNANFELIIIKRLVGKQGSEKSHILSYFTQCLWFESSSVVPIENKLLPFKIQWYQQFCYFLFFVLEFYLNLGSKTCATWLCKDVMTSYVYCDVINVIAKEDFEMELYVTKIILVNNSDICCWESIH